MYRQASNLSQASVRAAVGRGQTSVSAEEAARGKKPVRAEEAIDASQRTAPRSLSSEPHKAVQDPVLHYFGLRFKDREEFLDKKNPFWQYEASRLEQQLQSSIDPALIPSEELVDAYRIARDLADVSAHAARVECMYELSRIEKLRDALEDNEDEKIHISAVKESLNRWRLDKRIMLGMREPGPSMLSRPRRIARGEMQDPSLRQSNIRPSIKLPPGHGVEARIMSWKHGKPWSYPQDIDPAGVLGVFPNQRLAIGDSDAIFQHRFQKLETDGKEVEPNESLMYFHMPANEMTWVETVLTAYCERASLQQDEESGVQFRSVEMILRHHCWLGRARGLTAHNTQQRHMVPLCTRPTPGCVVLFVPYLNWETAKHHAEAKVIIQSETDRAMTAKPETSNQQQRSVLSMACAPMSPSESESAWLRKKEESRLSQAPHKPKGIIRSLTAAVNAKMPPKEKVRRCPLAQLLLDIASLHQAMATYGDRMLLKTNLHRPASLHPRRSLDQAQYGDEKSARDRDQVVYRATKFDKEFQRPSPVQAGNDETRANNSLVIPGTAKLVMVDQLWMWILDNHTVITAFSKRWGSTQGDASDVHQAIRNRMQLRSTRDWNAFDLGLIIIEECADALFNESSISQRPQVLDIFTEAIGSARRRQTQSLRRILYWSNAASKMRQVEAAKDILDLQLPLFDIGTEAALQMEINDITDELEMMIQTLKTQRGLLGGFRDQGLLELKRTYGIVKDVKKGQRLARSHSDRFRKAAKEILERFDDRIRSLQELKGRAQNVSDSLKDILALKQHQDGILQARRADLESRETLIQGRTIMVFTVVTIIFLPLSFMSSVFGMNAAELTKVAPSFQDEFKYILPISSVVIIITLLFAFSPRTRALTRVSWDTASSYKPALKKLKSALGKTGNAPEEERPIALQVLPRRWDRQFRGNTQHSDTQMA